MFVDDDYILSYSKYSTHLLEVLGSLVRAWQGKVVALAYMDINESFDDFFLSRIPLNLELESRILIDKKV